ncbi:MAG: PQQ-binding-like beta-propeller repeat protein [candidate division WOR-3 bacterium]|nr:MAG: PQQ-binding-like beta-propeller repeat protein [candidate division WOR-3 bacterium]
MRRAFVVLSLSALSVSILTCKRRSIPSPEIVYPFEDGLGVFCTAPAGTELRYVVDWGNGLVDTTGLSYAACDTALVPVPGAVARDAEVRAKAFAAEDPTLESDWASNRIRVATPGMALWYWVTPNEDSAPPMTAPVIGYLEGRELVYFGSDDEYMKVYGIDVETGATVVSGWGVVPEEGYEWISHPAWNPRTGHLLIPKEEGEFYAFSRNLFSVWHYPGKTNDEDLTFTEWGTAAVCGNDIYATDIDTIVRGGDTIKNVTKFYKMRDSTHMPVNPPFTVLGVQEVLGAPAIDDAGNVHIVTDSGLVYKLNPNLEVIWRTAPEPGQRDLCGPVLGEDGSVYIGSGSGRVSALDPDGNLQWFTRLAVDDCWIVVGQTKLYLTAGLSRLYCLDRANGSVFWYVSLGDTGFSRYPALAANGFIYCQDDEDKVYCVDTRDGSVRWVTDCRAFYPGRASTPRYSALKFPLPSPTITSNGDVIVAGPDALYCLNGYRGGPLDPEAPWPKWQRDIHNTGCMPQALGQPSAY